MDADMLRGTYVDPRRGAIRIREYGKDKFLPSLIHLRPNSAGTYASHLRTHVFPLLGDYRIGALGRSDVKSFVAVKARELAPSTVGNHPRSWRSRPRYQPSTGWPSPSAPVQAYGHLFQDAEDLGSNAVDDALADALAEQRRNKTIGEAPGE